MVSNGSTFNAYLMEDRPKLRRVRQLVGNLEIVKFLENYCNINYNSKNIFSCN